MHVLSLNRGSSSLKLAMYSFEGDGAPRRLFSGNLERIGQPNAALVLHDSASERESRVEVDAPLNAYLLDIVLATRSCEELHVGASTRGALALYRAAQSAALIAGRNYVVPDDIKNLAVPVLAHRVIPKGYLHGGQRQAVEALVERLVEEVPVPG